MKLHGTDGLGLDSFVNHLHGFGYKGTACQLEQGILTAGLEVGQKGSLMGVRYTVDREFLFVGDCDTSRQVFAVMEPGSTSHYHGATSVGTDICGFRTSLSTTDVSWTGAMRCLYVPRGVVEHAAFEAGAFFAVERLNETNAVTIPPQAVETFIRLHQQLLDGTLGHEDQFISFLVLQLCQGGQRPCAFKKPDTKNCHELTEMVRFLHAKRRGEPLPVTEWAKHLDLSESTLRVSCRKRFDCSPTELHQRIRLTQAYIDLEDGTQDVGPVMAKHKFRNGGQFAKDFHDHFGVLPSSFKSAPDFVDGLQLDLFAA